MVTFINDPTTTATLWANREKLFGRRQERKKTSNVKVKNWGTLRLTGFVYKQKAMKKSSRKLQRIFFFSEKKSRRSGMTE